MSWRQACLPMADPKKQQRRLRLAKRQFALAQIARREAMTALADAAQEEARSAMLAERSRKLLTDYSARAGGDAGHVLRANSAFVRRLADIAEQAGQASKDARDQAEWQVRSLAEAETKASRLKDRLDAAQKAIEAARLSSDHASIAGLAHKLHKPAQR